MRSEPVGSSSSPIASVSGSFVSLREIDGEGGAFAGLALDGDVAVRLFYDAMDDREAESRSLTHGPSW